MPRFRFQVRTGDALLIHGTPLKFDSFHQALGVAIRTMSGQALREADATLRFAESVLEIVDEAGEIVAHLPISEAASRQ